MKHLLLCLVLLSSIYHQVYATKNNYNFQYITLNEGLSHADANTIIKDNKGFLWIGTYSGLNRFDGIHIKSYYNNLEGAERPNANRILDMDISDDGIIWIGSAYGIYSFDTNTETFTNYQAKDNLNNKAIWKIIIQTQYIYLQDKNNKIHLYKIDKKQHQLIPINHEINHKPIQTIHKDNKHNVWSVSSDKITVIYPDLSTKEYKRPAINHNINCILIDTSTNKALFAANGEIYHYTISKNQFKYNNKTILTNIPIISDIKKETENDYWIGTQNGLFKLNINNNTFEYIDTESGPFKLKSKHINRLLIDDTGTLFIATYAGGVNYTNLRPFLKTIYQTADKQFSFIGETVRDIDEYQKYLFIGTHTNGILQLNKDTYNVVRHIKTNNCIADNNIRSMAIDQDEGLLWIAHGKGLEVINIHTGVNVTTSKIKKIMPQKAVTYLSIDKFHNVWAFDDKGIFALRKEKDTFYPTYLKPDIIKKIIDNNTECVFLSCDNTRPEIYFSTQNAFFRLVINKEAEIINIAKYQHDEKNNQSLKSNFISSIYRENDSILWVGHIGDALSRITFLSQNTYKAQNYPIDEIYNFKDFEEIQADKFGNLWIAGNGLLVFNLKEKKYRMLATSENHSINSYKLRAGYKSIDGTIYIGGNNGFTIIPPTPFNDEKNVAKPEVTDIYVNNKPLNLPYSAANVKSLTLKYNENNLTFYCSTMNYVYAPACKIKYQLKGADKTYKINKNASLPINYVNMAPGKYEFEVYACNNNDQWNSHPRKIQITILPPWWLSLPAKIVYGILFFITLYSIYRYLMRVNNLKHQILIQKIEQEQTEKINKMQLQLFTNISHELRGPLSLIIGIEEQMQKQISNIHTLNLLKVLHKNTSRLLQLINELMDFRKAKSNSFKLMVQSFDCTAYIRSIAQEFKSIAEHNNIDYRIITPHIPIKVYSDPILLEKIILNLLNNAFKYCNSGIIEIELAEKMDINNETLKNRTEILSGYKAKAYFYIRIKDTGIGISAESIDKVFDRYYQIEDSEHDQHLGSGVGLALVKELVLLHKGSLTLYSERNKGCEFILCFPADIQDYSSNEIKQQEKEISISSFSTDHLKKKQNTLPEENKPSPNTKLPILLIVEDNPEIQTFLRNSLSQQYNIITANHGQDAIEILKKHIPDIILSDLMMPVMNGNQLCATIKANPQFSDIPFILLTGKDTLQAQEESMKCGADVFLRKPTSINVLQDTLQNQLMRSKKIQQKISHNYPQMAIYNRLTSEETELAQKIISIINKNISNPELDANQISNLMGISRSGLYLKTKNIFNVSIIELVREIRLTKAIQIMCEGNHSMAEIASKVGFLNQSYFTASFKKKYDMTPTQYIKQLKNETNKS